MNSDTLEGQTRDLSGRAKETTGVLTGDAGLRSRGVSDQIGGNAQKAIGSLRDALAPITGQAKDLARTRPMATAALAGVVGLALLNTLRGKR